MTESERKLKANKQIGDTFLTEFVSEPIYIVGKRGLGKSAFALDFVSSHLGNTYGSEEESRERAFKHAIINEIKEFRKETKKRFDTLDSANEEITKLQQEVIEKTENIEKLLELLKTDISNPKQIQLYNIEMLFGFGVIAVSLTVFFWQQSIPLLILFLVTGLGIFTTAFVSKRKVLEINKECSAI